MLLIKYEHIYIYIYIYIYKLWSLINNHFYLSSYIAIIIRLGKDESSLTSIFKSEIMWG